MKHVRTLAVSAAALLAAGAGIAYAQQAGPAPAAAEALVLHEVGNNVTIAPGQTGYVRTRPCVAGELAISGSVVGGNPGDFSISTDSAYWDGGPRGWLFSGRNNTTTPLTVYATAFCVAATMANPLAPQHDRLHPGQIPGLGTHAK